MSMILVIVLHGSARADGNLSSGRGARTDSGMNDRSVELTMI